MVPLFSLLCSSAVLLGRCCRMEQFCYNNYEIDEVGVGVNWQARMLDVHGLSNKTMTLWCIVVRMFCLLPGYHGQKQLWEH